MCVQQFSSDTTNMLCCNCCLLTVLAVLLVAVRLLLLAWLYRTKGSYSSLSVCVCVCVCRISCCRLSQLLLYFVDNVVIVVVATIVTRQLHYRLNVFFLHCKFWLCCFQCFIVFFFAFVVVNSLIRSSSAT